MRHAIFQNGALKELSKPILGCPARCPIRVIKKFVQTKLNVQQELDVRLFEIFVVIKQ